jgi:hypothetical protein
MDYAGAFKKTRAILMDELCTVTSAIADSADDTEHWIKRLCEVNHALQAFEQMQSLRVVLLPEDQYQVMRTLLDLHRGNDDFGDNRANWPYNPDTLEVLIKRLDNLAARGL